MRALWLSSLAAIDRLGHRAMRSVADHLLPQGVLVSRGPSTRRRVALTFDDGPDAMTPRYLDVLARHGVRATFFVVGGQCALHGDGLVEILGAGHEVGHHGYHHRRFPELSRADIAQELRRTAELLPPARTALPMVRPPNGRVSMRSLAACAAAGFRTVLWSIDSDDCRTTDAGVVVRRLDPAGVRAGEIILLHEGQPWTLAALPPVIEGLRAAGFELCTVGDLVEERPS